MYSTLAGHALAQNNVFPGLVGPGETHTCGIEVSLCPIPVIGSVARGTQRLNCAMHFSMVPELGNDSLRYAPVALATRASRASVG